MPYLYIYQASDFIVTGLPDEVGGGNAAGSPPYSVTLAPGATPILVEVTENSGDTVFDELDSTQTITNDVTINGVFYPAGSSILTAYNLENTTTGHEVVSLHLGVSSGYHTGPVHGIVSTEPLVPGTTYTFDSSSTSHGLDNQYTDFYACFTRGARILTDKGLVPVENLAPGDMIATADNGFQKLVLRPSRKVATQELRRRPKLRPVRIIAGALGNGLPQRDLLLSPQHRMLVESPIVERILGVRQTLVAAIKLVALPGIYVDESMDEVDYFHLILGDHEIITAEGAPTESFYCGKMALESLPPEQLEELQTLFPELTQPGSAPRAARLIAAGSKQKQLIARHEKNAKPLLPSS